MLRLALFPDSFGRLRVNGAGPLRLPVKGFSRVRHLVIDFSCAPHAFCDICRMGRNLGGDDPLLYILYIGKGQVLRREQLLDKVWGIDFEGGDRAVDGRIKALRAALGPAGKQIRTVFKVGYKLEEGAHG